ncbi:MAG: FAD-dependent oxidoreductase [Deltaproteobacteria bacterium]|nr:FAD-dependent oxidoreductase [Candidatus Anaeroferrophillacea bacterium]
MAQKQRIVIVGGVACGPKTAARLRRLDSEAEITLIDRDHLVSYGACGLPYYVEGMFDDIDELSKTAAGVMRSAPFFEKAKGFTVKTRTEAVAIDRQAKSIKVKNLDGGEEFSLPYDKLVLATGARAFVPPIPGLELDNVYTVRHPDETARLVQSIEGQGLKRAILIGAGYIGVEMAEALRHRGLEVTIVEMFDQVMPQFLDAEMAQHVGNHIRANGVNLELGETVAALSGEKAVSGVKLKSGKEIPAEVVIVAVGVRPNDELARDAGIECHPKGGIIVDANCRTNDPDVYSGGDCVVNELLHPVNDQRYYIPLGSTANKHGRVIANHIAGRPTPFPGIGLSGICKVFDFSVGRTGFTERQARELGLDIETAVWSGPDRPHYMTGANPLFIKLVAEKASRKLLGIQVVGPGDADKRLDVVGTAIYYGGTVDDLPHVDLGYAPPFAAPLDAIATAAHVLCNKLDGLGISLTLPEAKERLVDGADLCIVDVRTPAEFAEFGLDDQRVINIPLGAVRERLAEIPRDKDVLLICKTSLRGYEAQRILLGAGYERVWFIEGGVIAWPWAKRMAG